ncbi:DUF4097 family beta strand repeat-containing protein [Niallia endozanthoxylica]|uniref:DUF4097 domain-containing protein n=1 Tax=Niallia endozanthoxylica TaxID=2036016 RepID=A0A5J5HBB0_9BACI|nr:DUF4097 domain-containing protein [Niallia endozanthoxylica]KAA9018015.1 DUF4097 domain-containing protein [Niallia endozanthoxylica]
MKEQRKRILQMVEEGKLTVDEALTLLERLEQSTKEMEAKQKQLVTELSTVVQSDEQTKQEKHSQSQSQHSYQSTKEKLFEFVDYAVKKIKDLDLDLNFGKRMDISHIFQQTDADFKDMVIDVANGDVRVIPWDQKDIRIECKAQVYRGDNQDEAKANFLKEVTFAVKEERLYFSTRQKWIKLETVIYVPESEYEYGDIRVFNGNVESKNIRMKKMKIKTANGKIILDAVNSQEVEAETANGLIQCIGCEVKSIDAETLNGAIMLNGDFRKAELQTFNGNIQCKTINHECEVIDAKTTTGNIELGIPEQAAVNGMLKSNLGNFNVELEGVQIIDEKSEFIQKSLSFKSVKESIDLVQLYADTKTGTIAVRKV